MRLKPIISVSAGSFISDVSSAGAGALRILPRETALALAEEVRPYRFEERPEHYGPRGVIQHFAACEEEDIPPESPVREFSTLLASGISLLVVGLPVYPFATPLCLNDCLLLRYPPGDVGLGAHRDHSQYRNLIVSLTLAGESRFNIHPNPDSPPTVSFHAEPGIAVFMAAPGFLGVDVRPCHSVTGVRSERLTLVLKQKGA